MNDDKQADYITKSINKQITDTINKQITDNYVHIFKFYGWVWVLGFGCSSFLSPNNQVLVRIRIKNLKIQKNRKHVNYNYNRYIKFYNEKTYRILKYIYLTVYLV